MRDSVNTALVTIGSTLAAAAATIGVFYQRYRKLVGAQYASLTTYISNGLRFHVAARMNRVASHQLSLKQFAMRAINAVPSTVSIPSPDGQTLSLPIDDSYVPLFVTHSRTGRLPGSMLGESSEIAVLLAGEPGSGKSTLLKFMYRTACRRGAADPRRARLPVYIELKNIEWPDVPKTPESRRGYESPVAEHISQFLSMFDKAVYAPQLLFDQAAASGGCIILLDGLDEVRSDRLAPALFAIGEFVRWLKAQSPSNRLILSTRAQLVGAIPREFLELFDLQTSLRAFEPDDVERFLGRWPFEPASKAEEISRIAKALYDRPSLADICTNPLILSMYVARDQRMRGALEGFHRGRHGRRDQRHSGPEMSPGRAPTTRVDFYSAVVNELLAFRRHDQLTLEVDPLVVLQDRQRVLSSICLEHMLDLESPVNDVRLIDAVKVTQSVKAWDEVDAVRRLKELSIQTGLFSESRPGESIVFMHRTICEFLAATALVESGPEAWVRAMQVTDELRDREAERTRLWETITFATAQMPAYFQNKAYDDLEGRGEWSLLLRCMREARSFDTDRFARTVEALSSMLGAGDPSVGELALGGELRGLALTVSEAERAAALTGEVCSIGLRQLFVGLCGERFDGFSSYLPLAMQVDPLLAISLASEARVDLFPAHLDSLVSVMSRPEVLKTCVKLAEPADGVEWRLALLLASQQSSIVARRLGEMVSAQQGTNTPLFRDLFERLDRFFPAERSVLAGLWSWMITVDDEVVPRDTVFAGLRAVRRALPGRLARQGFAWEIVAIPSRRDTFATRAAGLLVLLTVSVASILFGSPLTEFRPLAMAFAALCGVVAGVATGFWRGRLVFPLRRLDWFRAGPARSVRQLLNIESSGGFAEIPWPDLVIYAPSAGERSILCPGPLLRILSNSGTSGARRGLDRIRRRDWRTGEVATLSADGSLVLRKKFGFRFPLRFRRRAIGFIVKMETSLPRSRASGQNDAVRSLLIPALDVSREKLHVQALVVRRLMAADGLSSTDI